MDGFVHTQLLLSFLHCDYKLLVVNNSYHNYFAILIIYWTKNTIADCTKKVAMLCTSSISMAKWYAVTIHITEKTFYWKCSLIMFISTKSGRFRCGYGPGQGSVSARPNTSVYNYICRASASGRTGLSTCVDVFTSPFR